MQSAVKGCCNRRPQILNPMCVDSLGTIDVLLLEKSGLMTSGDVSMAGFSLGDNKFGVTKGMTLADCHQTAPGYRTSDASNPAVVPSEVDMERRWSQGSANDGEDEEVDEGEVGRAWAEGGKSTSGNPLVKQESHTRTPLLRDTTHGLPATQVPPIALAKNDSPSQADDASSSSSSSSSDASDESDSSSELETESSSASAPATGVIEHTATKRKFFQPVELPPSPAPGSPGPTGRDDRADLLLSPRNAMEPRTSLANRLGAIKPIVGNEAGLYTPAALMLPRRMRGWLICLFVWKESLVRRHPRGGCQTLRRLR